MCVKHHSHIVDISENFDDFAMAQLMRDIAWETMSTVVGQENQRSTARDHRIWKLELEAFSGCFLRLLLLCQNLIEKEMEESRRGLVAALSN